VLKTNRWTEKKRCREGNMAKFSKRGCVRALLLQWKHSYTFTFGVERSNAKLSKIDILLYVEEELPSKHERGPRKNPNAIANVYYIQLR
jgi:hypothetical protein